MRHAASLRHFISYATAASFSLRVIYEGVATKDAQHATEENIIVPLQLQCLYSNKEEEAEMLPI